MKIKQKKNYVLLGSNLGKDTFMCASLQKITWIKALPLFPNNKKVYYLKYKGNPPKWAVKWLVSFLKKQGKIVVNA